MNRIRTGKLGFEKHLGKSVGASRKRNLKKIAHKIDRVNGKRQIKNQ